MIYSVKFLVFALSSYIFQGIFIYMMYPPKAEERWGFPENTKVKKVLWHVQVTQEAEDNCFIIHLGSSNTLSALPSSVPHPSCGLAFNIVSPGCGCCQWDQYIATQRLCHVQCACLLPASQPLLLATFIS